MGGEERGNWKRESRASGENKSGKGSMGNGEGWGSK